MIEIFTGRIGGGKTYTSVARILAYLATGGHLFTNVELNWDSCVEFCARVYGVVIQPEQLHVLTAEQIDELHVHLMAGDGINVLVVIDEAHLWFNALDHKNTSRDFLTFLSQSRKVKIDVIFITQHAQNINAQFRRLTLFVWKFHDMQKFSICGVPWPFNQILAVKCDYDGKTVEDKEFVWKSKAIFAAYNTNALLKPLEFASDRRLSKVVLSKSKPAKRPFNVKRSLVKVLRFNPHFKRAAVFLVGLLFLIRIAEVFI